MKKFKKSVDELVEILTLILPISWVLACLDGATEYIVTGNFIRFFGHVFIACIASFFLLGFGFEFSGLTTSASKSGRLPIGKWQALGLEVLILFWITLYVT